MNKTYVLTLPSQLAQNKKGIDSSLMYLILAAAIGVILLGVAYAIGKYLS